MTKVNIGDQVTWDWRKDDPMYHPQAYNLSGVVGTVKVLLGDTKAHVDFPTGSYQCDIANLAHYKDSKNTTFEPGDDIPDHGIQANYVIVDDLPSQQLPDIRNAINFQLAVWSFDASPYRAEAEQYVAKYEGLDVTDEDVKDINRIIADLNKRIKEFEDARKEVKVEYNRPLTEFEQEIKSITGVYATAISDLKSKLEVYEQQYINQKTEIVKELIADAVAEFKLNEKYAANITILPKYLNKSETKPKIKKDLATRCQIEFTNQENERLAEEARAEKLQRRLDNLKQLNQNYAGRIAHEVLHKDTCHMSDEALFDWFKELEADYARQNHPKVEDYHREIPQHLVRDEPLSVNLKDPVVDVDANPSDNQIEEMVNFQESAVKNIKYTYICTISTTAAEDTILPWLKQMKEFGILTYVHKKEVQDNG